jgi:glutaminyl-peptide cyclotransferase
MTRSIRPNLSLTLLVMIVGVSLSTIGYLALTPPTNGLAVGPSERSLTLAEIPFNGAQTYQYLEQICALGPRVSGSPGMQAQQQLLVEHFQKLGAQVQFQKFRVRHPVDGSAVPMANLIVHWHPERKNRILLCAHYDTRPFPDRDPEDPRGKFVGANDGGSGAALLMELGRSMPKLKGKLGVDFVLFDGEELVFKDGDKYFLGSEYFAQEYVNQPPGYRYRWGVLLDMVGDAKLQIYKETSSATWRDTKPLVTAIWDTAARLGVREFIPFKKFEIQDDHLALHNIAKIPTCDIIDFDYPPWHTRQDTADKCSALSLAKVGWVIQTWLTAAVEKP